MAIGDKFDAVLGRRASTHEPAPPASRVDRFVRKVTEEWERTGRDRSEVPVDELAAAYGLRLDPGFAICALSDDQPAEPGIAGYIYSDDGALRGLIDAQSDRLLGFILTLDSPLVAEHYPGLPYAQFIPLRTAA